MYNQFVKAKHKVAIRQNRPMFRKLYYKIIDIYQKKKWCVNPSGMLGCEAFLDFSALISLNQYSVNTKEQNERSTYKKW